GRDNVHSLVYVAVNAQAHLLCGKVFELPKPDGLRNRHRVRYQRALLEHEVFEIVGKVFFGEDLFNNWKVGSGPFDFNVKVARRSRKGVDISLDLTAGVVAYRERHARELHFVGNLGRLRGTPQGDRQ